MSYEEQKAREIAARAERSDARKALAAALSAELEKLTGSPWSVSIRQDDESAYCPGEFHAAKLREAKTGLCVWMMNSAGWNEQEKANFSVSVPIDPVDGGARGFGSCPGVPYGRSAPETKANTSRPPAAIAKQIVAKVLTDETRAALAALAELDAERLDEKSAAALWRESVSVASGIGAHESEHNRGRVHWHNGGRDRWADIESEANRAGGKITLALPKEHDRAALMVAELRAVAARYSNRGQA